MVGGADLLNLIYPVGIIVDFGTEGKDFNPNTTWAPQKWKKLEDGRVTIASNATYPIGTTGGEEKHALSIGEIPRHVHDLADWSMAWKLNGVQGEVNLKASATSEAWSDNRGYFKSTNTKQTGGNQPHNNMQPYVAVNRWMRIS
jgi:microcystin-dependent protein|nr:MAG TPA: baseplate protein [Bacteriophage sp.]